MRNPSSPNQIKLPKNDAKQKEEIFTSTNNSEQKYYQDTFPLFSDWFWEVFMSRKEEMLMLIYVYT